MSEVLILISAFLFLQSTYLQSETCNDTCDTEWSGPVLVEIELPGYEGCSVTFTYAYRNCVIAGQPTSQIDLMGFDVRTNWNDSCTTLMDSLWDNNIPNWDFSSWVFQQGFLELSIKLFMQAYTLALPEDKFKYECPRIQTRFESVFKSCAQHVVYFEQQGPNPAEGVWTWKRATCDDLICCIRTIDICWDKILGELRIDDDTFYESGECSGERGVFPGSVWQSDCKPYCVEPE